MADMSNVAHFLQSCTPAELISIAKDALCCKDDEVVKLAISEMVRRHQKEAEKARTIKPVFRRKQKD